MIDRQKYGSANGEYWYVVSDETTSMDTFKDYGLRFLYALASFRCITAIRDLQSFSILKR